MKLNLLIFLPFFFLGSFDVSAQEFDCGSAQVNNEVWEHHPEKRAIAERLDAEAEIYTQNHYGQRESSIKVIPVVVHVIHDHGQENISKEQVLSAIDQLNMDYRAQNTDLSVVIPEFTDIIADCQLEFRLAKKDPNGNCTDGITRTVSTLTFNADEDVKNLISWNTTRYLNIWVVQSLANGAGGYSYYPGNAPSQSHEGVLLRNTQFGTIGTSSGSVFSSRTITHEVGHFFNLRHVWGNSNENAVSTNCSGDDNVNDTPNTIGSDMICDVGQVSCGSLDNIQNIMDYSTCPRMFTEGQKSRMLSALNSGTAGRNNLWQQSNLVATGTNNGYTQTCAPIVDFTYSPTTGCEGLVVDFQDETWNADIDSSWTWSWQFDGGMPATSNESQPAVTYSQPGTFDVSLTVQNSTGSSVRTIQHAIYVSPFDATHQVPFLEGVEQSGFPLSTEPASQWDIVANSSPTWSRNTTAAFSGNASVRINLRSISAGTLNYLISPALDFSNVSASEANMTFRMAHAPRNSNSAERLRVYSSNDCGVIWTIRYTKSGNGLTTNGGSLVPWTYVPDAGDWREETVQLHSSAGEPHVLIKFEALSDQENYLYIDDINLAPDASVGIADAEAVQAIGMIPDPITENSRLILTSIADQFADIVIVDMLGRTVGAQRIRLRPGVNNIALKGLAHLRSSGVYHLAIRTATEFRTVKFVKN